MKEKKWYKQGFTLMELIIVLAIFVILSSVLITSIFLRKSNDNAELSAIQSSIDDAIVGYYGLLGFYPIGSSGVSTKTTEVELNSDEITAIASEIQKYSGFSFIPSVVIEKYKFYLYYPQPYIFKIRVDRRSVGSGWSSF